MKVSESRWRMGGETVLVMLAVLGVKQVADALDIVGAGSVAMWFGVSIATLLLRRRNANWRALGLSWPVACKAWFSTLAWALVAVVSILAAMALIIEPVTTALDLHTPASAADRFHFLIGHPWRFFGYLIVVIWIGAALGEELLMRGFVLNRLADLFGGRVAGWAVAVVVNAAIFGSLHIYQGWHGVIATGTIGAVLSLVYLACGRRLLPVVIGHGVMNTVILSAFYLNDGVVN